MTSDLQNKPVLLSSRIKEQVRNLVIVLAGAVIFSFLMSTLSYFVVNPSEGGKYAILIIIGIAAGIVYILYRVYVFAPNAMIRSDAIVQIIYDRVNKEIIDDPFDGYYPQKVAWQAFERFRKGSSEAGRLIESDIGQDTQKHILTEILEYLIILYVHGDFMGFGKKGVAKDKTFTQLPEGLEKNRIISFFKNMKATDVVDRAMRDLELILPEDFEINYDSPSPPGSKDPNTFKISFCGKACDVTLTGKMSSHWPVTSMMSGAAPAPVFQNVYIREYHHRNLFKRFPGLWVVYYRIRIEARFKLRFGLLPSLSYMDWVDEWIKRFVGVGHFGGHFGGFDFAELEKRNAVRTSADMYETIKRIDASLAKDKGDEGVSGGQNDSGEPPNP